MNAFSAVLYTRSRCTGDESRLKPGLCRRSAASQFLSVGKLARSYNHRLFSLCGSQALMGHDMSWFKMHNLGVPDTDRAGSFIEALCWSSSQIIAMFSRGNDKPDRKVYDVNGACDRWKDVESKKCVCKDSIHVSQKETHRILYSWVLSACSKSWNVPVGVWVWCTINTYTLLSSLISIVFWTYRGILALQVFQGPSASQEQEYRARRQVTPTLVLTITSACYSLILWM